MNQLISIRELIHNTGKRFSDADLYYGHGTDNSLDEAFFLVMKAVNVAFDCTEAELDKPVSQKILDYIEVLINKRIDQRIPVAYLVNEAWFAGHAFYVDERVLIPRSPLAELITAQFTPWIKPEQVKSILDIGTGSGCIAIAVANYFPGVKVDAVDINDDAISVAIKNVKHHRLEDRVNVIQSDLYKGLGDKKYDIIISNPPYVGADEMNTLPLEYRHEPVHALEADKNGLEIVERLINQSADYLTDEGILIVEVGNSMEAVINTFPNMPFTWLEFEHGGEGVFLLHKHEL